MRVGIRLWSEGYAVFSAGVERYANRTASLSGRRRYGVHAGSRRSAATMIHTLSCGARGAWRNRIPTSDGDRFSLSALQGRHEATTFSHECSPPLLRGIT